MDVNDNNFEKEVLEKSKEIPIVVDFWASWCSPCLILGPMLEEISDEHKGKFILAKANVDENQLNAEKYGVRGIPAVKLFKDGNVIDEFVGAIPEQAIKDFIDKNLQ